jgi:predicted nuclease of predicted toxin-antitoxin system
VRVLLDEQLPRQLARFLTGHDVRTVQQECWAGLKNGELLDAAEGAAFDVLLTGDQNLQYQQNLTKRKIGIVVLSAPSNALEDLLPLVPSVLKAVRDVAPGQVVRVQA